jgi:branched-chain amino acid transport system permease protein
MRLQLAAVGLFVAAVGLTPFALDSFQRYQFSFVAIYVIAIAGLNLLTGYTGQISLGHGAFMAIGGYTTAILISDQGLQLHGHTFAGDLKDLWTIPLAGLVAGAAGLLFGLPALRLTGLYLALATFGIAVATPAVLKEYSGFTGGVVGKTLPLRSNDRLYYQNWIVALVLLAAAWLLLRGKTGRAFRAVRDSEVAAASSGVSLALYKTLAFGVSAFYAGVAGSLFAISVAFVNPDTYPVKLSIFLVVGAVAAGLGSLWGLPFGAALIEFLPVHAQDISKTAPDVIFGAVLIAVMILLPSGVGRLLQRLASLRR